MSRLLILPLLALSFSLLAPTAHAIDIKEVDQMESALRDLETRLQRFQGANGAHAYMSLGQYAFHLALYNRLFVTLQAWRDARDWLIANEPPAHAPPVAHEDWRKQLQRYLDEIGFAEARMHAIARTLHNHRPAGSKFVFSPRDQLAPPSPLAGGPTGWNALLWAFQVQFFVIPSIQTMEEFGTALGIPVRGQ